MSDVKAPKKADAGPKKTEVKKPEADKSTAAAETASADKPAGKADAAPKSASQTSISHFSSVSTPAYRSGWESAFGGSKKTKSKANSGDDFPDSLEISDEEIDKELRTTLYKLFQRQARRQGFSLASAKKVADLEYDLVCTIKEK